MTTSAKIRFEIEDLAAPDVQKVSGCDIRKTSFYLVEFDTTDKDFLQQHGCDIFADPLIQKIHMNGKGADALDKAAYIIEVTFRPGVTDNPAHSAAEAFGLGGITASVASGRLYAVSGDITRAAAETLAAEEFANPLIEKIGVYTPEEFSALNRFDNINLPHVHLQGTPEILTISLDRSDAELEQLSLDRCLALTLDEIKHIDRHYHDNDVVAHRAKKNLPAQPTDVEIEIIAQSWSEHCKHKIFSASISYTDEKGARSEINSLYKTYIKGATKQIEKQRGIDWLISVFEDNAGIVRFDGKIDLCIKAETHNSPSALDPYGGALTGILGVNRDILGCGLGALPIANTDVFCFAPPDLPVTLGAENMPAKLKEPKRIFEGVHLGVEDGGNKSGIPTVNGAIFFDQDYAGKPLVFCGTVGVMPRKLDDGRAVAEKQAKAGDRIFMAGGAIGADGIHGATFSSLALDENAPATAVQIGDPLTQKRLTSFLLEARDQGLYSSVTDNGAGGLSSSIGEMALQSGGAEIELAHCPVKYPGLQPYELMISESQERMSFSVPPEHCAAFLTLAKIHGVQVSDIGFFKDDGFLTVHYHGKIAAELDLDFLHNSLPQMTLDAVWNGAIARKTWHQEGAAAQKLPQPEANAGFIRTALLTLLGAPNIASKEKWVRRYDHEVQAATHIKPFSGKGDGPSDCGAIWLAPHGGEKESAVTIGCGLAPRLSLTDPYLMAQYAVDEALRNVVVSGGDPDMCCLLDNFCWPDPVKSAHTPDGDIKLGQLVRTCQGLYDICTAYGTPLVSGKDSMKNDYRGKDHQGRDITISILPTLLVTAMAKADIRHTERSDFQNSGDFIYLLGANHAGLGASEFAQHFATDNIPPAIDMEKNITLYRAYHEACQNNILSSGHDLADGGLLVALAESMIGGNKGAAIEIMNAEQSMTDFLFGEAAGRFLVSVSPVHRAVFEDHFQGHSPLRLGKVTDEKELSLKLPAPYGQMTIALNEMEDKWKNTLSL
ncbi:MAG: phosphoribosylformylglycinamidine synthase [Alphaproteobacteria bacterium]|nr:MAG: phosphoribosylformylglycinamidine synthase [Alphaproteobacteria bacterium]